MNKTAIIYITDNGLQVAERLKGRTPDAEIFKFSSGMLDDLWTGSGALVFIMASGIVVRSIAHLLRDKRTDPAVVVLDDAGRHVISLAGGHLGGANELAREIALFLGGEAVITTSSDVNGLTPVDLWARDHGLTIEDWGLLPLIGTRLVNSGALRVYIEKGQELTLPGEFLRVAEPRFADLIITNRKDAYGASSSCAPAGDDCSIETCRVKGQLYLRPGNLVLGMGCNSGTSAEEIEREVRQVLEEQNLAFSSVTGLATIDIKGDEPGLVQFCAKYQYSVKLFRPDELNEVEGVERSETVFKATGAYAVAEPAALLAAVACRLLVGKQKRNNVTIAIAEKSGDAGNEEKERRIGNISVVGTGPGNLDHITPAARKAIEQADVVVGYGTYLDLIREILRGKEVLSTGMTQEVDRCRKAIELSREGRSVAIVSGGDPGVYAMAGLVYELLRGQEGSKTLPAVVVVPGISALNAAAARLGAPLMHDFACISLSDRLTDWKTIEKRLEAAASADFVIVLYNPRSKGRADHLDRARAIVLRHRGPDTAVGIVKGAMRDHEAVIVTDLGRMRPEDVDMQTTVIIGNSNTLVWNHLMVTPRGYERKFSIR